jgi:ribonuclease R
VTRRIAALRSVADRLGAARTRRGSIVLDLPEIKILLDQDDPERVRGIVTSRADEHVRKAYNLIEELMVAANEAVARICVQRKLPAIYRVHDVPEEERVERLCAVADLFGVDADPQLLVTPKGFAALIKKVGSHPRRHALHSLMLRTLAQAEYSPRNVGHFALASPAYLHFTSPIRRYPDLINHRVMKAWLRRTGGSAGPNPVPKLPSLQAAKEASDRSSLRERATTQAERDAKALMAAHYMRDRIGDRFEGTISGVATAGLFVTLDDPPVDGMVRRGQIERELGEPWSMDALGVRMVAPRSHRTLAIGDRVVVEVIDASPARRQIDLALMGVLS